jgi:hypothetical protein
MKTLKQLKKESNALQAIIARIRGEFDNKQLKKLGALSIDTFQDIKRIIELVEKD